MVLAVLVSCGQYRSKKYVSYLEQERETKMTEKEKLKKQYADSTVYLSFCGIKLGEPFRKTISTAKSEGKIRNVKFDYKNDTSAVCKADLFLTNREYPVEVDVKVCSFQDTITSYMIMSEVYETKESILSLYKNKYNENAAEVKDIADYWGDKVRRSGSFSWIWTFKNQSITLSEFYEEKRENYVKDARMRSPENRYGIKYTTYFKAIVILYNDTYQCVKAKEYEDLLAAEEQKRKEVQEAEIKAQQEKQNARAVNQDI